MTQTPTITTPDQSGLRSAITEQDLLMGYARTVVPTADLVRSDATRERCLEALREVHNILVGLGARALLVSEVQWDRQLDKLDLVSRYLMAPEAVPPPIAVNESDIVLAARTLVEGFSQGFAVTLREEPEVETVCFEMRDASLMAEFPDSGDPNVKRVATFGLPLDHDRDTATVANALMHYLLAIPGVQKIALIRP